MNNLANLIKVLLLYIYRLNPDYDQAMNNLGNLLKDQDELPEAERLLERAVEIR